MLRAPMLFRFLILVSIPLAVCHTHSFGQTEAPDTLAVLSFNLHGLQVDGDSHDWDSVRTARLLDEIEALDPDLVGFQEVLQTISGRGSDNQLKTLADSLIARTGLQWSYFVAGTHVGWNRYNEGIGILTKLPVLATGFKNYANQAVFRRKLLWVRVETRLGPVEFFTTHLAYRQQDENTRLRQVRELKSIVDARRDSAFAAIVTGDFNSAPANPSILAATTDDSTGRLFDVYALVNPESPGYTIPANSPTSRIDYVFVRDTVELIPIDARVMYDDRVDGKLLSDHLGVYAELVLPVGVGIESDGSTIDPVGSQIEINVYPNPFASAASIAYKLPHPADVAIEIFDVTGRSVFRSYKQYQSAGRHVTGLPAQHLPPGVYLITLDAGRGKTAQPIIHF